MPNARVRFIGSRELHRDLPKVLKSLDDTDVRYVLTIHNKPKAILIGTEAFLELLQEQMPSDRLLALQLGALVQGLISGNPPPLESDEEVEEGDSTAQRQDLVTAL
ncbi:MAG: type II toxin-antitoxin system Phd/YefM family antitoxin [Isosphaeraceae bacterium]